MNTTEIKRRADQFADELMPRDIWFLAFAPHDTSEAASFSSQRDLIEYCENYLGEDEILYAISSCLNKGQRVMVTHTATDILNWIEDERTERELDRRYYAGLRVPA